MNLSNSIQRWGLIKTFALFSFISIVTISVVSGYLYFSLLRNHLLQHEINVSSEFIQSVTQIGDQEAFFLETPGYTQQYEVIEFLYHIISMPDVFRVVAYNANLKILWANNPDLIGKTFTDNHELHEALEGHKIFEEADMDHLVKEEHVSIMQQLDTFIESYIPVWNRNGDKVIGVLEIYKAPTSLYKSIDEARFLVVIVSLISAVILHWVLYGIVRTAHRLIEIQRRRIRQATNRAVELNEQNLRRIGSELHDGPAQTIGFALLIMDALDEGEQPDSANHGIIEKIRNALQDSLRDIRNLSSGLVIPELDDMSINEVLSKAIDRHEKTTGTDVSYQISPLPNHIRTSIKICIYRLVQEGLNNAFHHAKGKDQCVNINVEGKCIVVSVADGGSGMSEQDLLKINSTEHLGLRGLRERVESLGGMFMISNAANGHGLQITARIPIND